MEVFAVFEAFGHLFGVVLGTVFVRPLDATSRRRMVARGGEADLCAIGEIERSLYQAFAK